MGHRKIKGQLYAHYNGNCLFLVSKITKDEKNTKGFQMILFYIFLPISSGSFVKNMSFMYNCSRLVHIGTTTGSSSIRLREIFNTCRFVHWDSSMGRSDKLLSWIRRISISMHCPMVSGIDSRMFSDRSTIFSCFRDENSASGRLVRLFLVKTKFWINRL